MLLLLGLLVSASYVQAARISPMYVATSSISVALSINGSGIAQCEGYLVPSISGTTPVLTLTLKRTFNGQSWSSIKTWSATGTYLGGAAIDVSTPVASGYLYKLYATGRIYDSRGVLLETVYNTSHSVAY